MGAVCDVSVLSTVSRFEQGRQLVKGPLYLPSSTYSWAMRDRVIGVRSHEVRHSLLGKLVRECRVMALFLPEILDEIARQLLFTVNHRIPLTDLRASLLAAHLKLPVVSLDPTLKQELVGHLGAFPLGSIDLGTDFQGYMRAMERYRKLAWEVGMSLSKALGSGGVEFKRRFPNHSKSTGLEFLVFNLLPVLEQYLADRVLSRRVVEELCRHALVGIVCPDEF